MPDSRWACLIGERHAWSSMSNRSPIRLLVSNGSPIRHVGLQCISDNNNILMNSSFTLRKSIDPRLDKMQSSVFFIHSIHKVTPNIYFVISLTVNFKFNKVIYLNICFLIYYLHRKYSLKLTLQKVILIITQALNYQIKPFNSSLLLGLYKNTGIFRLHRRFAKNKTPTFLSTEPRQTIYF